MANLSKTTAQIDSILNGTITAPASMNGVLGSNILLNGDFATNDLTNWNAAAGWSASTGKAVHNGSIADTTPLVQNLTLEAQTTYLIKLTQSTGNTGSCMCSVGSIGNVVEVGIAQFANPIWITFHCVTAGTYALTFTPSATFNGSVDSITVQTVTANTEILQKFNNVSAQTISELRGEFTTLSLAFGGGGRKHVLGSGGGYTSFGNNAGAEVTTGWLTAFGSNAGAKCTIGKVSAFGQNAAAATTIGNVTAFGYDCASNNVTGNVCAFGYDAGYHNLTANMSAFGQSAGYKNESGTLSAFGFQCATNNVSGTVSAFGDNAALNNTTGNVCVFGGSAGRSNVTGNVTAFGWQAGYTNNNGIVTAFGYQSAISSTGAITAFGYQAGLASSSAQGSVYLGNFAGYYETGGNKLMIDNATRASEADARVKALIYGVFDSATANQLVTVNGNINALEGYKIAGVAGVSGTITSASVVTVVKGIITVIA